jgi:bla regulator protein blaR1
MFAALGNHLWQSTVFAIVAGALTWAFRNNRAHVRHCLWLAASFKFLVPLSVLTLLGSRLAVLTEVVDNTSSVSAAPQWSILMERVAQPLTVTAQSAGPATAAPALAKPFFDFTPVALAVWLCGVAVVLGISLLRWRRIHAALRTAQPFTGDIQLDSEIAVKSSTSRMEPGVIGILRPVLLLPLGISERLGPEQLQAIIAHELCHVRRRDNLTGALHLVVQALFWFHPLVWWIGARIVEERERACDEAVLASGSDPSAYAEGLLNVCEFYLASPLFCTAGVSGADLRKRIEAIARNGVAGKLNLAKKALLTMAALLTVTVPVAVGIFQAPQARAQTTQVTPDSSPAAAASIAMGSPDSMQRQLLINPSGQFTTLNLPLKSLISFAYDIQETQIAGPAEALARLYSIDAKTAVPPSPDHVEADFRSMVQGLLADRFKMSFHWETRRVPVYALLGGGDSGIKQAAPGDPGPFLQKGMSSVTGHGVPFAQFVKYLATQLDRPILDQTGLTARYNFTLKWGSEPGEPGAPAITGRRPPDPSVASLIELLQKQLGIQVVPQEGDVSFLVIDHIEQPSNLIPLPKEVTVAPNVFDHYVGYYGFPGNAVMTVSRDGNRFLTQLSGQPQIQIFASSEREFFTKVVNARITFVTNDEGVATRLVLHQGGMDISAPRISEAEAKARASALAQRVHEQKAAPGSEAALRKQIEALQRNQPDYEDMSSTVAAIIRPRWAGVQKQFAHAGQLQSITFKGVGPGGADIYQARFEKGTYEMRIELDATGKISGLSFRRLPAS